MNTGTVPPIVSSYPWIDEVGKECRIDDTVTVWRRGNPTTEGPKIVLKDGVVLFNNIRLILPNEEEFSSKCEYINSGITIGNRVAINTGTYLSGEGGLIIEDEVLIGARTSILTGGHDIGSENKEIYRNALNHAPVKICKGAWLGAGCIVLPGRTVGEGAVVGAGAVVTRDIPPYAVAIGNPARVVKYRFPNESSITNINEEVESIPTEATIELIRQNIENHIDFIDKASQVSGVGIRALQSQILACKEEINVRNINIQNQAGELILLAKKLDQVALSAWLDIGDIQAESELYDVNSKVDGQYTMSHKYSISVTESLQNSKMHSEDTLPRQESQSKNENKEYISIDSLIDTHRSKVGELADRVRILRSEVLALRTQVLGMNQSTSWRITYPLRYLSTINRLILNKLKILF